MAWSCSIKFEDDIIDDWQGFPVTATVIHYANRNLKYGVLDEFAEADVYLKKLEFRL
jgi:hypothetical protein